SVVADDHGSSRSVAEQLVRVVHSMSGRAQNGAEHPVLEPPHVEFLIVRIAGVTLIGPAVSGDVRGPIRKAGHLKVEAGRDLAAESHPSPDYIARPDRGGITLLTEKCRAREDEHALAVRLPAPVIVHAAAVHQREDVGIARTVADRQVKAVEGGVALPVPDLRLAAVEPESVPAFP